MGSVLSVVITCIPYIIIVVVIAGLVYYIISYLNKTTNEQPVIRVNG
jgi:hypothetical protein